MGVSVKKNSGMVVGSNYFGAIDPSGTINIAENGTYDVAQYASATVEVPTFEHFEQEFVNMVQGTLTTVDLPREVTKIGDYAFSHHTELVNAVINEECTEIGEYAFQSCTSLESVNIPNSVTKIEAYAFYGCTKLPTIHIPDGITIISAGMFYQCSQLNSINIPDSVTRIGGNAFNSCRNLPSITIPVSVTRIDGNAFANCTNLTDIYYTGTQVQWEAITELSGAGIPATTTIHYEYVPE